MKVFEIIDNMGKKSHVVADGFQLIEILNSPQFKEPPIVEAREILSNVHYYSDYSNNDNASPDVKALQVCASLGVRLEDLQSSSKSKYFVRMRQEAAVLMRAKNMSYPEIGKVLKRHHTTVMRMIEP